MPGGHGGARLARCRHGRAVGRGYRGSRWVPAGGMGRPGGSGGFGHRSGRGLRPGSVGRLAGGCPGRCCGGRRRCAGRRRLRGRRGGQRRLRGHGGRRRFRQRGGRWLHGGFGGRRRFRRRRGRQSGSRRHGRDGGSCGSPGRAGRRGPVRQQEACRDQEGYPYRDRPAAGQSSAQSPWGVAAHRVPSGRGRIPPASAFLRAADGHGPACSHVRRIIPPHALRTATKAGPRRTSPFAI